MSMSAMEEHELGKENVGPALRRSHLAGRESEVVSQGNDDDEALQARGWGCGDHGMGAGGQCGYTGVSEGGGGRT